MKIHAKAAEMNPNEADVYEGPEDYSIPVEEFLDRNFGRGTWVFDPYNDKFVVYTGSRGKERSYTIIDRNFQRFTANVSATRIN